jgi:hypothetical protein
MQLDTWYDLAVRQLGELTDHAKEMLDEAEEAETVETAEKTETASPAPKEDADELPAVPPAATA